MLVADTDTEKWYRRTSMYDEIFHFEIFKNFMEILKYVKTPSLKYFMKFLIFIMKYLKLKNMIKVYEVSRKYIVNTDTYL